MPRVLWRMELFTDETLEMVQLLQEAAAREILPRFGAVVGKEKGEQKRFKDLVTEADLQASNYILDRIRKSFPGSYSEEHKYPDRFEHELIWQIDPLDGTQEFVEGYAEGYACHAALLERRADGAYFPVAGIIYLPGTDKVWYNDGSGDVTFINQGKRSSFPASRRDSLRAYSRRVDPNPALEEFYGKLAGRLGLEVEVIPHGGAGASIAALLGGELNLVILNYNYTKEWDLAMAEPIVRAAGGFICDLEGQEFVYNRPDVPGYGEPYNLNGYVISIDFKKEEIIPYIDGSLLIDRL